jgi:hypothetical protein
MRYRPRTLMIVLALGPMLAWLISLYLKLCHAEPKGLFEIAVSAAKSDYPEVNRWIQIDTSDSPHSCDCDQSAPRL